MSARIEDKGDRIVIWNGNAHKRGPCRPSFTPASAKRLKWPPSRVSVP
ncbi:hypothetical protein Sulfitobl28_11090 [Sulfitobacter pontiacus]|nr:hypothetical protein Sulfitobl28_11090 [Sulfitobacter pontiacus]